MISVGNIKIGNRNFIPVQTMLKNPVWEIDKTLEKIERLEKIGCDILRITVPDQQALAGLKEILKILKIRYNYNTNILTYFSRLVKRGSVGHGKFLQKLFVKPPLFAYS